MKLEFVLPFPPKELNPNKKAHWAAKNRAVKAYRKECNAQLKLRFGANTPKIPLSGKLLMHLRFVKPDNRKRDDDNMEAAFKAGRDEIAAYMGIDDNRFAVSRDVAEESVRGGCVRVTITPIGAA